ncbi:MBL fold metallo-hydrolase [Sporolactobacillus terrae]|uniref:MBL fold metallo-hydrolase n=1 Tax=Sporolactobacillus terrae TaxID=269673 RepID=A0ABX5Q808_9BACL|nr:MBL fold metallo-hydrolase [Sporolactobacillus terrae]QAA22798.1 MBL fold metallo-hydrolase [Sporolactobacillus terrae]QAA25771.1 MBL fold metallo-hydrolase [Sporolactobacillus terrae]UAK17648.1 MBL fold metallo-hydrolase [Sporolactobacillus terrae]
MKWTVCPFGPIQANCYILIDNSSDMCLIIDPGEEFNKIKKIIAQSGAVPQAVLLTHAHFDHIGALDAVRDEWAVPAYGQTNEADWPDHPEKNGSAHFAMAQPVTAGAAEHLLEGNEHLSIGSFSFKVLPTPGHSPGGVSFYFPQEHTVFCGDALFRESIGRTDQYGGNQVQLLESIREQLLFLPDETVVCPGHGPSTTIGHERIANPFLMGLT